MRRTIFHRFPAASAAMAALLLSAQACSLVSPVRPDEPIGFAGMPDTGTVTEAPGGMDSFAVWAWCTSGAETVEVFSGEQVYWDSWTGAWTCDRLRFWDEGTYVFHALHPYSVGREADCTAGDGFSIAGHTTGTGGTDLMVSTLTRTYDPDEPGSSEAVAFRFRHLLSRIRIVLSGSTGMTVDELRLSGVTLTGDCFCGTAPEDTRWTLTGAADGSFAATSLSLPAGQKVPAFPGGLMLIPQSPASLSLTARVNGQSTAVSIPVPASPVWQPGRSYTYDITLSPSVSVTVTESD